MEKFLQLYIYNGSTAEKAVFPTSINGYEKNEPIAIDTFDYSAKRMGDAPTISASIMHPICLDNVWSTNVYVEFNGEKYFLKNIPTSSKSNTDARYKHEVLFVSERYALNDVYLFDVVRANSGDYLPTTNSTRFEFNGTIWDWSERINQSLKNSNVGYAIDIPTDKIVSGFETSERKSISVQDMYIGNALQELFNTFEVPYYFEGKTIKLGDKSTETLTEVFEYGSTNALLSIAKNNANFKIVNRITGTGSSENIPYYYPNPTPMGFVNFFSKNEEQGVGEDKVDKYVSIVDTERFNAKFRLSTKLKYIDNYQVGTGHETSRHSTTITHEKYGKDGKLYYSYRFSWNINPVYLMANGSTSFEIILPDWLYEIIHPNAKFTTDHNFSNDDSDDLDFYVQLGKVDGTTDKSTPVTDNNSGKYVTIKRKNGTTINKGQQFVVEEGVTYRIYLRFPLKYEYGTAIPEKQNITNWSNSKEVVNYKSEYGVKGWFDEKEHMTTLQAYGISIKDNIISNSFQIVNGTELYAKQDEKKGGKIPQCSNLMPSIYRLSSGAERFYSAVNYGNKNLVLNSGEKFENKNYLLASYDLENATIAEGERVTISFNGEFGNGYATFRIFASDSMLPLVTGITASNFNKNTGRFEYSFTWREYGDNKHLLFYQADENQNNISSGSSVNPNRTESKIWDVKLEYGNTATKYISAVGESNAYDSYLSPINDDNEYYEFANTYNGYNPKEHTINFEDIKPTIKEAEYNGLRIDIFEDFAFDTDDNNDKEISKESSETLDYKHPYFYGKLRPLGFNLFDRAIDSGSITIEMTSGHCGGAKFEIVVDEKSKDNRVHVNDDGTLRTTTNSEKENVLYWKDNIVGSAQEKQNDTTDNYVWVLLKKDTESFSQENNDWVYPDSKNRIVPTAKNDTFVITNILLPESYIIAAEKRLDEELIAYMFQNNNEKFTFSIKFSRIYLAEHPNVYNNLSENSSVNIKYNNNTYSLYVSSYSYKVKSSEALPEISVELTDTLTISQSALQNALNEVKQSVISIGQANVLKTGNKYFTRKDVDDTAQGLLTYLKGSQYGDFIEGEQGASIKQRDDEHWSLEIDNVSVRDKVSGKLCIEDGIEIGKFQEVDGTDGSGAAIYGSDNGEWTIVTDNAKIRKNAIFNKGLTVGNYVEGLADGTGASISGNNEDGWTIEADYLNIRRKARFNSVEIQHTQHVGGGQVLSAAGALIDLVILHEEYNGNVFYRCYFKKQDAEGNAIFNKWMIGDQARCETFNLSSTGNENGNHYYWRLVTGTSNEDIGVTTSENREVAEDEWVTDGEDTIFVHEYHWVDLCDTENYYLYGKGLDVNSDIPKKGDDIFLLGHRFNTNKNRQSAIYEVAGDDSGVPYYRQYVGINSFSLDGCLEQQMMPNANIFKGAMTITGGEAREELDSKATLSELSYSASNLLRNTGFYGDGKSAQISNEQWINVDEEMMSPSLLYWTVDIPTEDENGNMLTPKAVSDTDSASGYALEMSWGEQMSQNTDNCIAGENYIISLRLKGSCTIEYGGESFELKGGDNTYFDIIKSFKASNNEKKFTIVTGTTGCRICELMLERGTIPSNNWQRSIHDVSPEIIRVQNLQYLADAMQKGQTDILGGLILTNMIQLGKPKSTGEALKADEVTCGINGNITQGDNEVAIWGGGTWQQAKKTVELAQNPQDQPTQEELADMAKFVITHGGLAILNEAIVRGTVFATNGRFSGEVNATSGTFRNGTFENVVINGTYNKLFQTIDETNLSQFFKVYDTDYCPYLLSMGDAIRLESGTPATWVLPCINPYIGFDEKGNSILKSKVNGFKKDGTQMSLDDVRSLIGRKIIIYNYSGNTITFKADCWKNISDHATDEMVYRTDTPYTSDIQDTERGEPWHIAGPFDKEENKSFGLGAGIAAVLECMLGEKYISNGGDKYTSEMVFWTIRDMDIIQQRVDIDNNN